MKLKMQCKYKEVNFKIKRLKINMLNLTVLTFVDSKSRIRRNNPTVSARLPYIQYIFIYDE